jgi:hypothetical protein
MAVEESPDATGDEIIAQVKASQAETGDDIEAAGNDIVEQVKGSRRDMRRIGDGLADLTRATVENASAVADNARALTRSRTIEIVLAVCIVLSLVAIVLGGVSLHRLSAQARCLQQYASDTSIRQLILTDGRKDLDRANARVLLDAFNPGTLTPEQQRARLVEDGKEYTKANEAYTRLLATHPVPPPPKLSC